jgi:hypothetical protein
MADSEANPYPEAAGPARSPGVGPCRPTRGIRTSPGPRRSPAPALPVASQQHAIAPGTTFTHNQWRGRGATRARIGNSIPLRCLGRPEEIENLAAQGAPRR